MVRIMDKKEKIKIKYRNMTIKQKVIVSVLAIFFITWIITNIMSLMEFRDAGRMGVLEKSRAVVSIAEASRENMTRAWKRGIFDRNAIGKDRKYRYIHTVPMLHSINAIKSKSEDLQYEIRVPKTDPRNPENRPDDIEAAILSKIKEKGLNEYVHLDKDGSHVRYFRTIRLTGDCLICHGDPARSRALWGNTRGRDVSGRKMEGKKEGEIYGAYEVIYSVRGFFESIWKKVLLSILINLLVVAGVIFLIRFTVKRALSPLDTMSEALEDINSGEGDLTKEIDIDRDDEVGHLAELFNRFIIQLRNMMLVVKKASDHVAQSSEEMTGSSESLASLSQEQAASIEQTSSAMEEIKATIDSVSENAREQAKKADTTRESMEYLASSIDEINKNAQEANHMAEDTHSYAIEGEKILKQTVDSMTEIYNSSVRITDIVTIITDISDQINLLSLNASIEAARAGEHGRGFAVVAEEISKLADQTSASSKEINSLINESNNRINMGSELMKQTVSSLRDIIENVKKTAGLMVDIAASSVELNSRGKSVVSDIQVVNRMSDEISIMMEEQSLSSNEIIKAINQINDVTQNVASGSEELAAESEELSSQAELLRDIVDTFKLGEKA